MNKTIVKKLKDKAEECARYFSDKTRDCNYSGEDFEINEIVPLSENTAVVIFKKSSGKKAVTFFFLVKDKWYYFFPTDSHILGMENFGKYKLQIEKENFKFNFETEAD